MSFDSRFLQRAFLAFTTGLFLACAARISGAEPVQPTVDVAKTTAAGPINPAIRGEVKPLEERP